MPLSHGRSCRGADCGGRWKGSWSSTSPSLVWPAGSGCRGTPRTTRSWPKEGACSSTVRPVRRRCRGRSRRRVQQARHGHRGRKGDPLYNARRTLHTGADLLTGKQAARLRKLFASDAYVEVEATWGIYQRMIAAYREPIAARGRN